MKCLTFTRAEIDDLIRAMEDAQAELVVSLPEGDAQNDRWDRLIFKLKEPSKDPTIT